MIQEASNDIPDIDDKTNVEKGIENIEKAAGISEDLEKKYFISKIHNYQQAKAVCKACKSKLATYSQVEKAYNDGGNLRLWVVRRSNGIVSTQKNIVVYKK